MQMFSLGRSWSRIIISVLRWLWRRLIGLRTHVNHLGSDLMSLVNDKAVVFPGVTTRDVLSDLMYNWEVMKKFMERHLMMMKFCEVEYGIKLGRVSSVQKPVFNSIQYKSGYLAFIQEKDKMSLEKSSGSYIA